MAGLRTGPPGMSWHVMSKHLRSIPVPHRYPNKHATFNCRCLHHINSLLLWHDTIDTCVTACFLPPPPPQFPMSTRCIQLVYTHRYSVELLNDIKAARLKGSGSKRPGKPPKRSPYTADVVVAVLVVLIVLLILVRAGVARWL